MNKFTLGFALMAMLFFNFLIAQNEPPDFPGTGTGPSFNLAVGANTYTGTVTSPGDTRDNFQIVLGVGQTVTSITASVSTNGNPSGFFLVGFGSVSFPGGNVTPVPSGAGTYQVIVGGDFALGNNWTITVNVTGGPPPCTNPTVPTVTATPNSVCPGGTSTLTISGTLNDATSWAIYTGSCGGTLLGNTATSTFVVSPGNPSTNYYVRGVGGCVTPGSCGSVTVSGSDNTPPNAVCQNINIQLNASGVGTILVSDVDGGSTDNCGIATRTVSRSSFDCSDIGENTVVLTITDNSGNSTSCNATVTVLDSIDPVITCPANINVSNDSGICGALVTYNIPTATDNCSVTVTQTDSSGLTSGNIFPVGINTLQYTATDPSGNSDICSFTVTVTDTENPVITCPGTITQDNDAGICGSVITYSTPFSDNCPGSSISQTAGFPSGSEFPVGTTTNTFVATDAAGNTAICSFDVIINDTEAPNISCPGNITQDNDTGVCGAVITYTAPVGTDNCSGTSTTQTAGLASGSTFPVGTTVNTFLVTDAAGNISSCSFEITINDFEAPVANCASPFTIQLDANGMVGILVADIDNGSTDNCSIETTSIDITDFDCSDVGPNTVTLTVTDVNGNSSTCTTIVTVEDNVVPVANCAAPFTIQLDANGIVSITVADIENGSTDACGITSTTIDIDTFDCSNIGENNVVLSVTDVNGNVSSCTNIVTVEDNIAPTIACPADISVNTDAGNCFATVNFVTPIAFDNCGVDSIVQTMGDPSGSQFPVGMNTIEFTATDVNGNSSTCSFIITVVDNEAPVAVCQNITIQLDEFGNANIVAADVDGGSSDQCGVASISIDMDTFDCSNIGDNNVILTVTDINGNLSTCTAIVTVEDVTSPVVACQNITVEIDPVTGTVTILGTDIDNGSTDACGIASYDFDMDTFDCSNIGDNTVVLTVTDVNGNTATCTAIVTVEDNTSPVLVCQDFTIEIGADGTATLSPNDVIVSNDDACGILTVAVDITAFSCADIGTPVTVQVFSQDNNGNLSTCTARVTAVDLLAPEITCPADQTVDPGAGNLFYIVPDYFGTGEATAIDNCTDPITITTQEPSSGTTLSDGTYPITLTATDEYGNTTSCDFELIVDSILGIGDDNQSLGTITMYPNPAKGNIAIGNPQSLELESADIYDLMGRLVKSFSLKGMATAKTLNVDNLAAANYVVIIKGKNGQVIKRLLKE